MKRIISLLISLALILSVIPNAVIAADNTTATITIKYIDEEKNTIKDNIILSETYEAGSIYTLSESYTQDFAVKTADGMYNHYVFNKSTSDIPEYYSNEMTVTLVFNNDMQYDFYEDFENYTLNTANWHEQASSVPDPTIENSNTKYINHITGSSTTGGYMTFDEVDTTGKTAHISADIKFTQPSGSKKGNSQITICNTSPTFSGNNITWGIIESSAGHIIALEYNGGTTFKVNNVAADTAFIGDWVHMEADVDFGSKATSVTLTNKAGKTATYESTIFSKTFDMNLGAFYMRSAGETASTSIDNLTIKITGEAGEVVPDIESVLNFKSVYAFGDSIVYGHNSPATSFMRLIANDYAMDLNMMAKNGATIMTGSNRILTQINNAPKTAPDFVVFEGYTNDAYGSADTDSFNSSGSNRDVTQCYGEITPDGTTTFDNSTFCGAFEETVYAIKQKWPESQVVFVTIHKSGGRDFEIQTKLRDLSIQMCEKWDIKVVDMYSYENEAGKTLDTRNADEMSQYIIGGKGSHPNEKCCREFYIPAVVEVLEATLNNDETPTPVPTEAPTVEPTEAPTEVPTTVPTEAPTEAPTAEPTEVPTIAPTTVPTEAPTAVPTSTPEARKIIKIIADYNEDGYLIDVSVDEIDYSDMVYVENTDIHKVFYWESLKSMTPITMPAYENTGINN